MFKHYNAVHMRSPQTPATLTWRLALAPIRPTLLTNLLIFTALALALAPTQEAITVGIIELAIKGVWLDVLLEDRR